ncbi:Aste57867_13530 [Aphanomyces stellatus]|uniref:Aste57867_13530 protein n=1 Tax=Aphanomyces stellatus TaxID=120398 RepID=A0A485KYB0_9STRA|nr:hypothetical protein As57867_013480 [Aphanomyces stellatus]VFT90368.1 Aste57867_13530 [Aphanomyces stellatus]
MQIWGQASAVFVGVLAACSLASDDSTQRRSTVLWPTEIGDDLSLHDNAVHSTGKHILLVHDVDVSLDVPWDAAALSRIEVSIIPRSTDAISSAVWTQYAAATVSTIHDTAGFHIRVHPSAPSTNLSVVQESVSRILRGVLGRSYVATTCTAGCEHNTFHFNSTFVYANASCDVPAHVVHSADSPLPPFCFVASRDASHLVPPSFLPSTETVPLHASLSTDFQVPSLWHVRATHLDLSPGASASLTSIHFQQAVFLDGASVGNVGTATHVIQTIAQDGLTVLSTKDGSTRIVPLMSSPSSRHIHAASTRISGAGFHQLLHVSVQATMSSTDSCHLLIEQPFPTTAYADMDELRRLERFNAFTVVSFAKHIEIERPAALSSDHVVAFVLPLTAHMAVDIPVHFRYQFPSNEVLYRSVHLVAPSLYVHCDNDSTERSDDVDIATAGDTSLRALVTNKAAHWTRVALPQPLDALEVRMPVGNLNDGDFVTALTLLVSVVGALLLYVAFLPSSTSRLARPTAWVPRSTKQSKQE